MPIAASSPNGAKIATSVVLKRGDATDAVNTSINDVGYR